MQEEEAGSGQRKREVVGNGLLYNPASPRASNSCSTLAPPAEENHSYYQGLPFNSLAWDTLPFPAQDFWNSSFHPDWTLAHTSPKAGVCGFPLEFSECLTESLCCLGWVRGVTNGYTAPWLDIPRSEASPEICKILPDMRLSQRRMGTTYGRWRGDSLSS